MEEVWCRGEEVCVCVGLVLYTRKTHGDWRTRIPMKQEK